MEELLGITYRCNARCQMCNIWIYPTALKEEFNLQLLKIFPELRFADITIFFLFNMRDIIPNHLFLLNQSS